MQENTSQANPSTPSTPLEGVFVLDLTHHVCGSYATKLLAEYGADVLKVERPGSGDLTRAFGPFPDHRPDPERSGMFLYLNTNKRGITLNLKTEEGRRLVKQLAERADIIVSDYSPRDAADLGISYDQIGRPSLVMTSITNFGLNGPYRDYEAEELNLLGFGGPLLATGSPAREPSSYAQYITLCQAGTAAAAATAIAYQGKLSHGSGAHVDLAITEVLLGSMDKRVYRLLTYQYFGMQPANRMYSPAMAFGIFPCRDGYVHMSGQGERYVKVLQMMGREDLIHDPRFATSGARSSPENIEAFTVILLEWLMQKTGREVWQAGQEVGVLTAPMMSSDQVLADEHYRGRDYWREVDAGDFHYTMAGRPFIMYGSPGGLRRLAPKLGEHNREVFGDELGLPETEWQVASRESRDEIRVTKGETPPPPPSSLLPLPLAGLRVLDLTVIYAGPTSSMLLADWGAEVIRFESFKHYPEHSRGQRKLDAKFVETLRRSKNAMYGYVDFEPGERPWNRFAPFNVHARNKLSAEIEIDTPEGREIFLSLVAKSDIVIENNAPPLLGKLKLDYDDLRKVKEDIILIRMPAFGLSGPYRDYKANGANVDAATGHTWTRGYPDAPPSERGTIVLADAISGATGALAAALALIHRHHTGKGQLVEIPMAETFLAALPEGILAYSMNGDILSTRGNRSDRMAPHGCFPCAGDDRWVTIAVRNDAEWRRLCEVMGFEDWLKESRFGSLAERLQNQDQIEERVARWTKERDPRAIMAQLQAAGLAAVAVLDEEMAFADPHLQARQAFAPLTQADCGTHLYLSSWWLMNGQRAPFRLPPCRFGEHTEYVKQLLEK